MFTCGSCLKECSSGGGIRISHTVFVPETPRSVLLVGKSSKTGSPDSLSAKDVALSEAVRAGNDARQQLVLLEKRLDLPKTTNPETPSRYTTADQIVPFFSSALDKLTESEKIIANIAGDLQSMSPPEFEGRILIPGEQNSDKRVFIVCQQVRTSDQTYGPIPVNIVFRDVPRLVATAGLVFSSIPSGDFRVRAAPSTLGPNVYEITDSSSRPQSLPFVFLNVKVHEFKFRRVVYGINCASGIGLNVSGDLQFAVAPSLSIGRLYISGGLHLGRGTQLINGYKVGDIVPQNFAPPTGQIWQTGYSIGITYRVLPIH